MSRDAKTDLITANEKRELMLARRAIMNRYSGGV
jgi:hypothetical protein